MRYARPGFFSWLLVAVGACVVVAVSSVPGLGDVITGVTHDNFESSATDWTNGGGGTAPTIVLGGPAGTGDHYLQVVSAGGLGAGSKLITFDSGEWHGSYNGVTAIAMDLKNLGANPLSMRIALKQGLAKTSPGYASTNSFSLPVGSGWQHVVFSLDPSALTALGTSPPTLSALLANVAELRILSATAPNLDGDAIAATVGIDNITAIPEPTTLSLLVACGLCFLASVHRRRQRTT